MGICAIVGVTLNTNAYALWAEGRTPGEETSLATFLSDGPCSALRFFMIPFCVASYSGIINQEAPLGNFAYLFPTRARDGTQLIDGVPDTIVILSVNAMLTIGMLLLRRHVIVGRCWRDENTAAEEPATIENPL